MLPARMSSNTSTVENSLTISAKTNIGPSYDPAIHTEIKKCVCPQKCMHANIQSSFIHNKLKLGIHV